MGGAIGGGSLVLDTKLLSCEAVFCLRLTRAGMEIKE